MIDLLDGDVERLEAVEHAPFTPIGELYASIFADLCDRGLVTCDGRGAFAISDAGRAALAGYRTDP